jgi:hypothetical protein
MTVSDTPQPAGRPEDEGIPDHAVDTSTAYDEADRPRFDDSPPPLPADRPQAVDEFGVTGEESRRGEAMPDKLAREEPDGDLSGPRTGGVGRLVEPDEGARTDQEKDTVATDAGEAGGGLAAEEAAMHELSGDEVPYER